MSNKLVPKLLNVWMCFLQTFGPMSNKLVPKLLFHDLIQVLTFGPMSNKLVPKHSNEKIDDEKTFGPMSNKLVPKPRLLFDKMRLHLNLSSRSYLQFLIYCSKKKFHVALLFELEKLNLLS